jgi:hypothetical protein
MFRHENPFFSGYETTPSLFQSPLFIVVPGGKRSKKKNLKTKDTDSVVNLKKVIGKEIARDKKIEKKLIPLTKKSHSLRKFDDRIKSRNKIYKLHRQIDEQRLLEDLESFYHDKISKENKIVKKYKAKVPGEMMQEYIDAKLFRLLKQAEVDLAKFKISYRKFLKTATKAERDEKIQDYLDRWRRLKEKQYKYKL